MEKKRFLSGPSPLTPIQATWSFFSDVKIQDLKVTVGRGGRYDSLSDVGEIRVWFASKILTPCRMH